MSITRASHNVNIEGHWAAASSVQEGGSPANLQTPTEKVLYGKVPCVFQWERYPRSLWSQDPDRQSDNGHLTGNKCEDTYGAEVFQQRRNYETHKDPAEP